MQLQVLASIGIIVASFLIGFLFFYSTSSLSSDVKKKALNETASMLINLVIYIWIAKIVWNIDIFIGDPLAVLAYPSDSAALYIATGLTGIHIGVKVWRGNLNLTMFITAFVPIFLTASFMYEFIQMVWYGDALSWFHLALLMVLSVGYLLLQDHIPVWRLSLSLMGVWSVGQLILAYFQPFTTVFGYMVAPWYLMIVLVLFVGLNLFSDRKKVL